MAALYWHREERMLTPNVNIGSLRIVIENNLRQNWGFSDVRRSELDVTGVKNNVFVSIAHFQINGPNYWEVVMGTGDNFDITKNTVDELAGNLHRLVFFD